LRRRRRPGSDLGARHRAQTGDGVLALEASTPRVLRAGRRRVSALRAFTRGGTYRLAPSPQLSAALAAQQVSEDGMQKNAHVEQEHTRDERQL